MKHSIFTKLHYPVDFIHSPSWLAFDPVMLSMSLGMDTEQDPTLTLLTELLYLKHVTFEDYKVAATRALLTGETRWLSNLVRIHIGKSRGQTHNTIHLNKFEALHPTFDASLQISTTTYVLPNLDKFINAGELPTYLHLRQQNYRGNTEAPPPTNANPLIYAHAKAASESTKYLPNKSLVLKGRRIVPVGILSNSFPTNRYGIWPYTREGRRLTIQETLRRYSRLPFLSEYGYKVYGSNGFNLWIDREAAADMLGFVGGLRVEG